MHKLQAWAGGALICLSLSSNTAMAQDAKGWHLKDKEAGGYYGISLDKAYEFLKSKNKKSATVIVAVIDSGIDTLHEDLKPVLWRNRKEIPGNGIDDDKNGYVDDIHGWNFLGGKDGRNVKEDSYEGARVYHRFRTKYDGKDVDASKLPADEAIEYEMWKKAKANIIGDGNGVDIALLRRFYKSFVKSDSLLKPAMAKDVYTGNELDAYIPATTELKNAKATILQVMKPNNAMDKTNKEMVEEFTDYIQGEERKEESKTTAPKSFRGQITGDDESNLNDRNYGNNDIMASTPMHGTHVSGIIAAKRGNGKGMDGVADNVEIMTLRAVPDGDEHDKDIALAIRYAVDNGAKVINMSFGKSFSPEKHWIDEAVRYAQSKGVLLVHAAGNDGKDVDVNDNFPCPAFQKKPGRASNWITVGASGDPKLGGLAASFSNYGVKEVDVFAPGVQIYSTLPGGTTYGNQQGTSMASPVVAGIAALVKSYFPSLSPEQIKTAIEKSSTKPEYKTAKPGSEGEMVNMDELAKTGGIVSAYGAVKAAYEMSETKTPPKKTLPKSKVSKPKKG
jgi:subtilisin family serine protease